MPHSDGGNLIRPSKISLTAGAKYVERSKVVGPGGKDLVDTARTSYGTFLVRSDQSTDPVVVVRFRLSFMLFTTAERANHLTIII